jgi:hypothetical protein
MQNWRLVPSFWHLNKPSAFIFTDRDIDDPSYSLRQCFYLEATLTSG